MSNSSSSSFVVSYHKPHNAIGEFAKNFDWVKDTDKLTFAHLKELFIAVNILGDDYKNSIKALKEMKKKLSSENDQKEGMPQMGFKAMARVG